MFVVVGCFELVMMLVFGLGDVDLVALSFVLWELGCMVRGLVLLIVAFDVGVFGLFVCLKVVVEVGDNDVVEFDWCYGYFLRDYGNRGFNEWEFRSYVWGINFDLLLVVIDWMCLVVDVDLL